MGILSSAEFPKELTKKGWPWDKEVDETIYSAVKDWPKITVITPSYNQGSFLEETIRSILLQNYPNLEYIIIDGGSQDNSIEVVKKYEKYISYWISEKDYGQSHAINKGIYQSTGELINWINSDDILLSDCLFNLALRYVESSNDRIILIGHGYEIDEHSNLIKERKVFNDPISASRLYFPIKGQPTQQSIFFSKKILIEAGGINPLIRYPMDIDLYIKMGFIKPEIVLLDNYLGGFRKHSDSKTISQSFSMMEEKVSLLKFLCYYDSNKEYYYNLIVFYILYTSFKGISLKRKLKYVFLGYRNLKLKRQDLYKFRILINRIFD